MKKNFVIILSVLSLSSTAFAFEHHHDGMRAFQMGLCVGQVLAAASPPIILPVPVGDQMPMPPDPATKVAIDAAIQECLNAMKGPGPSATPAPSAPPASPATPAPSASPSPVGSN